MRRGPSLIAIVLRAGCGVVFALTLVLEATDAWAVGEPVNGFPNWAERVIHEWINRARVDPQLEMNACGSPCVEHGCYGPLPPLSWNEALNRAARYHSDELVRQGYFAHDSACTVVSNINTLYPTSCNGAASCACVGGTRTCTTPQGCTAWWQRVQLFGGSPSGEIIASPSDPNQAFYLWLFEPGDTTTCEFTSSNGHRWLILTSGGAVGVGVAGYSTGDFGAGSAAARIPSGAHYPQQAASVEAWANWYDTAGPSLATVNVDGTCTSMGLRRGTQTNGAWSATVSGVGSGCHRYYFSFRDAGGTTVTYPTTGSLGIGTTACADWDSSRPATCTAGSPAPTNTSTATATATRTASRTASRTSTATATASRSATPTRTPIGIPTLTPTFTVTPSGKVVSGFVRYYSNDLPVSDITLQASGATTVTTSTDASGHYALSDVPTQDVLVYADRTGGTDRAVSALDASYVLQYVAGLRSLSAQQALACDVTGNGSLSALDATLLLQYATGLITSFPVTLACDSDWAFIPNPVAAPNQTLIQPQPGAEQCVPGGIEYATLTGSLDEQNFSALVFGDCTGNWQPPATGGALKAAFASARALRAARLRALPGGRLAVSVAAENGEPVYALDVRVAYDPAELRLVNTRLVGSARHAAMAINAGAAGIVRIAVASSDAIAADGRPLVVILFEGPRGHRAAAPSVSVRFNDD